MKPTWRTDWLRWLLLAGMLALAAFSWNRVPERLPVHWNLQGDVDRMGGTFEGLLAVPLTAIALYVMLLLLPRIDPGRENYARFIGTYHAFRNLLVAFMAALYGVMHMSFRGHAFDMKTFIMPGLGGWVFIFGGLAFLAAGLLRRPWLNMTAMVLFGAGIIGVTVYSWWVWKHDPDRTHPAGTRPA